MIRSAAGRRRTRNCSRALSCVHPTYFSTVRRRLTLAESRCVCCGLEARHTKGDELTFVEPDRTLISGDVVQNKTMPNIYGDGGTPASWVAVLDKIAALNAAHVLPDHSAPGDGSLVAAERSLISGIRTRALALKGQGVSVDDAGKQISGELKTEHPDWPNTNAAAFVKSIYAEQ